MRGEKGQVLLVELALILPLLLVLVFGLLDFGRLTYLKSTLINAARSGARAAAVTPSLYPVAAASLDDSAVAKAVEKNIFNDMAKGDVQYQLKIFTSSGGEIAGMAHRNDVVEVKVTWLNPPMLTPFWQMARLVGGSAEAGNGLPKIEGVASMRYENE